MHIEITLASQGNDVTGTFGRDDNDPVTFQGWLELLRHLEAAGERAADLERAKLDGD